MSSFAVSNARVMTCARGLDLVEGAVVIEDGTIVQVGGDAPAGAVDAGGRLVTPGLVDCHAHPIFGGERAREFALRAAGASYLEIARAGGGIASTVAATRAASDEELITATRTRLDRALATGTTTMEAKTGYALDVAGELRLLRLLAAVAHPIHLRPTLLGAHAVAPAAVLTSAFRMAQSAMASEPSFIASVSRLGEATEPQSRWSRPMTMGALTLPELTSSWKRAPTRARSP